MLHIIGNLFIRALRCISASAMLSAQLIHSVLGCFFGWRWLRGVWERLRSLFAGGDGVGCPRPVLNRFYVT